MSETKVRLINNHQVNEETVEVLSELLAMAKAGKIKEVAWASRDTQGGKFYGYAGQAYDDPLGVAGLVGKLQMALTCHGFNPCKDDD